MYHVLIPGRLVTFVLRPLLFSSQAELSGLFATKSKVSSDWQNQWTPYTFVVYFFIILREDGLTTARQQSQYCNGLSNWRPCNPSRVFFNCKESKAGKIHEGKVWTPPPPPGNARHCVVQQSEGIVIVKFPHEIQTLLCPDFECPELMSIYVLNCVSPKVILSSVTGLRPPCLSLDWRLAPTPPPPAPHPGPPLPAELTNWISFNSKFVWRNY